MDETPASNKPRRLPKVEAMSDGIPIPRLSLDRFPSFARQLGQKGLKEMVFAWRFDFEATGEEIADNLKDYGIEVTAQCVLNFCRRYSRTWRLGKAQKEVAEIAKTVPNALSGNIRKAMLAAAASLAVEDMDPELAIKMMKVSQDDAKLRIERKKLRQNAKRIEMMERELAMAEKREAELKRAVREGKDASGGLTPEALEAIERQLSLR